MAPRDRAMAQSLTLPENAMPFNPRVTLGCGYCTDIDSHIIKQQLVTVGYEAGPDLNRNLFNFV